MAKQNILVEIYESMPEAFEEFKAMASDSTSALNIAERLMRNAGGLGITVKNDIPPVPMFNSDYEEVVLESFNSNRTNRDRASKSVVISCEIEEGNIESLASRIPHALIWPNSDIILHAAVDCSPFTPAVDINAVRTALNVQQIFNQGYDGTGIVVGIVDQGVDGQTYPVIGGYSRPGAPRPGTAPISSHGSMCAADVQVAAPSAKLYDYPFLGIQNSGGVITMMQEILNQRRIDGTPHVITNSYGFYSVPPQAQYSNHEIWNLNHPTNRKVKEVVTSGAPVLFAAGNCGANCPSGDCHPSSIGPGKSIHGPNSLNEVITVAAVNTKNVRIGYSSQGPGMFEKRKPDVACYSHFFGNFGPGRPAGGTINNFDDGTSAATPVAAGVVALLIQAFGPIAPSLFKAALETSAFSPGGMPFNGDIGHGIIDAWAAFNNLRSSGLSTT